MDCGQSDFAALVEIEASRWDEIKGGLSDWVVDKFVRRALGEIDDIVDYATNADRDHSLEALQRARKRLDQFLDEWAARKPERSGGAKATPVRPGIEENDTHDDDEDEDDE